MFKDKLKDNRLRLGLSQEDLAQKIFVSRSAVAKWEQGRGIPEDDSLERLSELFGIPSDVLLSKEDMKQEVMSSERASSQSRKKAWISMGVASACILALSTTLICGAVIYRPSGVEASDELTLSSLVSQDGRTLSFEATNGLGANYSDWSNAKFSDEFGEAVSSVEELHLRENDHLTVSYLADRNWFGQKRIGASKIGEIALKSHSLSTTEVLNGVAFAFLDEGASLAFSASQQYLAFYSFFYFSNDASSSMSGSRQNVYSHSLKPGNHNEIELSFVFDTAKMQNKKIVPYYETGDGVWNRYYFNMETGLQDSDSISSVSSIKGLDKNCVGAVFLKESSCGYQYVHYAIHVISKNNPAYFLVKSYEANDALISYQKVTPTSDLYSLLLPSNRSYSVVEEYSENDALVSASGKLAKGQNIILTSLITRAFLTRKKIWRGFDYLAFSFLRASRLRRNAMIGASPWTRFSPICNSLFFGSWVKTTRRS